MFFCPGAGFGLAIGGALPEEPMKYDAFSLFSYRTYVCDPDAIMSMALVAGAGFALVENIEFIYYLNAPVLTRVMIAFPMHCLCQLIMGVFVSSAASCTKSARRGIRRVVV